MNILEILLGQIPEAIYFALFIIYTKQLKNKRLIFIVLTVIEYLLLLNVAKFNFNVKVLFFVMIYCLLKILYHNKAQITDIFIFAIASIILMLISIISFMISLSNMKIAILISRIFFIIFFYIYHNKLYKIQSLYKKYWNRNDSIEKKMKTTTFRALNLVLFNLMFYIINIGMLYCVFLRRR